MALRRALQKHGVSGASLLDSDLVAQFTSIGGLKGKPGKKFLDDLLASFAAGGRDLAEASSDSKGGSAGGLGSKGRNTFHRVSFVWPTRDEVRTSTKGYVMGGSIPGRLANVWEGDARQLLGMRSLSFSLMNSLSLPIHDLLNVILACIACHTEPLFCRFSVPASDMRPEVLKDPWGRGRSMPHIKVMRMLRE
jgi:hypothetical protein